MEYYNKAYEQCIKNWKDEFKITCDEAIQAEHPDCLYFETINVKSRVSYKVKAKDKDGKKTTIKKTAPNPFSRMSLNLGGKKPPTHIYDVNKSRIAPNGSIVWSPLLHDNKPIDNNNVHQVIGYRTILHGSVRISIFLSEETGPSTPASVIELTPENPEYTGSDPNQVFSTMPGLMEKIKKIQAGDAGDDPSQYD